MVKIAKKFFTVSVVAMTIMWSVGIAALVPMVAVAQDCPELEAGDLFKVPGNSAVYLLNADMERMYFPNGEVYKTWYEDFSGVEEIPNTCVDAYPAPSVAPYGVNYRAGSRLVKVEISPSVYLVEPGNMKTKIGSEEVAMALYGADWASKVRDVADVYWPNYAAEGSEMTEAMLHNGMVVTVDGTTNYTVVEGMLYEVDGTVGDVQTVSQDLVDAVEMGATTVTAASVVANPAQVTASPDAGDDGEDVVVVEGELMVSLAASTPNAMSIPDDAEGLHVLSAIVKAGDEAVTVTGLKITRSGASTNAAIANVFAKADGRRLGSVKTLGSTDVASLSFGTGSNPVELAAGESKTFDIYANMTDGGSGSFALGVTEVSTKVAADVSGLPVTGNTFTIVNIDAPDVAVAYESVGSGPSVGDTDVEVFKIKVTNNESNEDAVLTEMTLKNGSTTGTRADSEDVTNFRLYIDGESDPIATAELSSLRYLHFVFNEDVVIEKGGSKYKRLVVKADFVGGPTQYMNLELDQATDLVGTGTANEYPLDVTTSGSTTDILIAGGDLTVSTDTTNNPAARTLQNDAATIDLLAGKIAAAEEDIKVTAFGVYFEGVDIDADDYENLKVWVGDQLVIDEFDPFNGLNNATTSSVTTADEFEVTGTQDITVQIGSKSTTDANDTLKVSVRAADITASRVSDDGSVTPGGTATGKLVTFSAASLTAVAAATPASATLALGSTDVKFAGFTLTAGTASDMDVKSVKFAFGGSGGTVDRNDISNIRLMESDGTTVLATGKNLDSNLYVEFTSLTGVEYLNIGDGLNKKLVVVADINATLNDSDVTSMYLEMIDLKGIDEQGNEVEATVSASDITTTNEVNDDGATATITVATRGYLTVKQDSTTAQSHQLVATTADNALVTHEFQAYDENITIKKLVYTSSATTAADDEYTNVSLWANGEKLMDGGQPSSGVVTFELPTDKQVLVEVGSSNAVEFTLKGDLENSDNNVLDSDATHSWSINNFASDVEADGASEDVFAEVVSTSGTGVTLTAGTTTTLSATTTDSATTITVASAATITNGDLIKIESEYMLVVSQSGTTITVRRAVGGTTAAAHNAGGAGLDVTPYDQKIAGNAQYFYANKVGVELSNTPAGGDGKLRSTSGLAVLRFIVTPDGSGTEPALLNAVTTTMYGVGATSTGGWLISNVYLYNIDTGLQVGSTYTTDLDASGETAVFSGMTEEIDTNGVEFEVRVDITATDVGDNDSMSFAINGFGSAGQALAGGGSVRWSDTDTSLIDWVDTTKTSIEGNGFNN